MSSTTPPGAKSPDEAKGESPTPSTKDQFKTILKEYGKVALLSHVTIWALTLAVTYAGFRAMDMHSLISMLPNSIASHIDPSAGAFAVAFVLVKLTGPLRLMIDVAIAPTLASYLRHTALAGPLGLRIPSVVAANASKGARRPDSYREVGRLAGPIADESRERLKARARSAMSNTHARLASMKKQPPAGGGGASPRAGEGGGGGGGK